jgi:hypothetical protein
MRRAVTVSTFRDHALVPTVWLRSRQFDRVLRPAGNHRAGVGGEGFARSWIEIKHVAAAIEFQLGAPFKRRKMIRTYLKIGNGLVAFDPA